MGKGLFCNIDIKKGNIVTEYSGEVFNRAQTMLKVREELYNTTTHTYLYSIDKSYTIDAT